MKEHKLLKEITDIYLEDTIDSLKLTKATKDFKEFLLQLSEIDLNDTEGRKNIQFENGNALGTIWAAMCVDDMKRTKRFIKGLFEAVTYIKSKKSGPVQILYAGSGPFATLILPILVYFTPQEVQCTLLEINPISYNSVKQVLSRLGFDDHIKSIENQDATTYKINEEEQIDIILSETMQHALQKEQQVPIMINLLKQVPDDTIMIPENISLELGLLRTTELPENDTTKEERFKRIGKIFELSKEKIKEYISKHEVNEKSDFPETTIELSVSEMKGYQLLVILTDILVYGNERIGFNESGLTIPRILEDTSRREKKDISIKLQYKISGTPGIEYSIF